MSLSNRFLSTPKLNLKRPASSLVRDYAKDLPIKGQEEINDTYRRENAGEETKRRGVIQDLYFDFPKREIPRNYVLYPNFDTYYLKDGAEMKVYDALYKKRTSLKEVRIFSENFILRQLADLVWNGSKIFTNRANWFSLVEGTPFVVKDWCKALLEKGIESQYLHCENCFVPLVEISSGIINVKKGESQTNFINQTMIPLYVGHTKEHQYKKEFCERRKFTTDDGPVQLLTSVEDVFCPICYTFLGNVHITDTRIKKFFISPEPSRWCATEGYEFFDNEEEDRNVLQVKLAGENHIYKERPNEVELCRIGDAYSTDQFHLLLLQRYCNYLMVNHPEDIGIGVNKGRCEPFSIVNEIICPEKWLNEEPRLVELDLQRINGQYTLYSGCVPTTHFRQTHMNTCDIYKDISNCGTSFGLSWEEGYDHDKDQVFKMKVTDY